MPFFGNDAYMNSMRRFWIWVVLTVPSTAAAFLFYWWLTGRRQRRINTEVSIHSPAGAVQDGTSSDAGKLNAHTAQGNQGQNIAMQVMGKTTV